MTSPPHRNRGFTLLEVVVALTITAMLLVVVYNAVYLGIRAQREVATAVHDNDEIRAFTYFLRRQFRHVDTTVRDERLRFTGDRHHIRCALRGFRGDPSTYLLELRALPAGEPRYLTASIRRAGAGRSTTAVLQSRIGGDLRGVGFEFFGKSPHRDVDPVNGRAGSSWQDTWRPDEQPPQLVRIRFYRDDHRKDSLYLAVAGADGNQVAGYAAVEVSR